MRDQTYLNITINYSPKTPKNILKQPYKNMQRRPGQGTFGGRFGGRKSLQSRKSGRFGGTFGGRKCQTETKVSFRGHLRQPNAASTRGVRRPKLPSAAEPGFCQTGRNLVQMNLLPPKTINHAYISTKICIQVPRGLKHT